MRAAIPAFFGFVIVILLLCFYSSQQLIASSIHTFFTFRSNRSALCSESNCSIDDCFGSFMKLVKGCDANKTYCIIEPDPPIPIGSVNKACRRHLIPKPPPSSLSKKTIQCYSHRRITDKTRPRVREGLSLVKKLFDENKIPLIVDSGSLLGSLRYHGVIPYDDDFDFRIPNNQKTKVKALLAKLCQKDKRFTCDLSLIKMDHYQVHIGITKGKRAASFIDFFFYSIKGRNILWPDLHRNYRKSIVFPTIKRPMEGQLFDFPRDSKAYRRIHFKAYHPNECHAYDHRKRQRKGCRRVPCSQLNSFLPFLVAAENSAGRLELVVEKAHVRSIFLRRNGSNLL